MKYLSQKEFMRWFTQEYSLLTRHEGQSTEDLLYAMYRQGYEDAEEKCTADVDSLLAQEYDNGYHDGYEEGFEHRELEEDDYYAY